MFRRVLRITAIAIFSFGSVGLFAQDWKYEQNEYGVRSMKATLSAQCGDKSIPTLVRIYCQPEKRGFMGFDLTIQGVKLASAFHFDEFEGPDAPGGDLFFELSSNVKSANYKICPNGGYGPDGIDQFTFSAADFSNKTKSVPRRVLNQLANSDSRLVITIQDPKDSKQRLSIQFPVIDRGQLQKLLAGLR